MKAKTALRNGLLTAHAGIVPRRAAAAIVLSCYARSGSTWLSEILGTTVKAATLWEPFHLDEAPKVKEFGFGWREYIPADADWPEAEALIRKILAGRFINTWTGSASRAVDLITADRLLVKCCRANGFLPWMVRRIEFEMKPIHFLRHPFAMVPSMLKFGNFDGRGLHDALFKGRYVDRLDHHTDYILGLQSDEERIVAMWCRSQLPCLTDPDRDRYWVTSHYETLLLDPEAEMARIFSEWDRPVPPGIPERVGQPSRMTQKDTLKGDAIAQISKWQTGHSDSKQRAMLAVLSHFGVTCYGQDPLPVE